MFLIVLSICTIIPIPVSRALSSSFEITDYEFDGSTYIHGDLNDKGDESYWYVRPEGSASLSIVNNEYYTGGGALKVSGISGLVYVYTKVSETYLDKLRGKYIAVVGAIKLKEGNNVNASAYILVSTSAGGCPVLYVWNGREYVKDNNLLPIKTPHDVTDYYLLRIKPEIGYDGIINLEIREDHTDKDYIDMVKLYAVLHSANTLVAIDQYGRIRTYIPQKLYLPREVKIAEPPISNEKLLNKLLRSDGEFIELLPNQSIIVNFGNTSELGTNKYVKLVITTDQPPYKESLIIQVLTKDGWRDIARVHPRENWYTEVVDLSNVLPDVEGEYKIRIVSTESHKIDFIALDFSMDSSIIRVPAILKDAYLIANDSKTSVLEYVIANDEKKVSLVPTGKLSLEFWINPKIIDMSKSLGLKLDFVLVVDGYYEQLYDPQYLSEKIEVPLSLDQWQLVYSYIYVDSYAYDVEVGIRINATASDTPVTVLIDSVYIGYAIGYDDDDSSPDTLYVGSLSTVLYYIWYGGGGVTLKFYSNLYGVTEASIKYMENSVKLYIPDFTYTVSYLNLAQWNDKNEIIDREQVESDYERKKTA